MVKGRIVPVDKQKSIPTRIKEMLAERGIKDPNEGKTEPTRRTVVNIIFGGSTERMREIAFGNQTVDFDKGAENPDAERSKDIEQWALDVYNFAAAKWGEENITGFVVHLDETNPHVHCTLLPIVEGKFSYKKMFVIRMVVFRIATALLDEVFSSLREAFPYSDTIPTERLQTFVERCREIAKCAALLFAGYVDEASNFS